MPRLNPSHRSRLEACLNGEKLDRPPIAMWRHFPVADQLPETLAAMAWEFQRLYDFDLIKFSPASSYCLVDYGVNDVWRGNPEGTRDYAHRVIKTPEDWVKLEHLNPLAGMLGKTLESLEYLKKKNSDKTPILQTIFNPLAQAKNLAGQEMLLAHLKSDPGLVLAGLKTITDNILVYIEELRLLGIDGVFYAIQHAQDDILTPEAFEQFSIPFDQQIFSSLDGFWLNMIHLHGTRVMFDAVSQLPAQVINWHDRESGISLSDAKNRTRAVLCGGLSRDEAMLLGDPILVRQQLLNAYEQTGGTRWIAGTGCVLMTTTPSINIHAARAVIEELG